MTMAWWTWGRLTGALVRRIPATLVDMGSGGCLIDTMTPLAPGAVGVLELDRSGGTEREAVRICHTTARPGSAVPFRTGAEFLVLDAAGPESLRERAASRERAQWPRQLTGAGENSGTTWTTPKAAGRQKLHDERAVTRDHGGL